MSECIKCGKTLFSDEIGLYKKLVNRGSEKFMCIDCMSRHFDVSASELEKKIEQYKALGCTLFSK